MNRTPILSMALLCTTFLCGTFLFGWVVGRRSLHVQETHLHFAEGDLATAIEVDPLKQQLRVVTYQGRIVMVPILVEGGPK